MILEASVVEYVEGDSNSPVGGMLNIISQLKISLKGHKVIDWKHKLI
jgi:hypothetical protein